MRRDITEGDIHQAGPAVRLQLVGLVSLQLAGDTRVALNANDAALLALPVLDPTLTRAAIARLIWPDSAKPLDSLRQRARQLSLRAGCPVLTADGATPVLRLQHELDSVESQWRSDPAALPGELLGHLAWPHSPELQELVERARTQWRTRRATALARLAEEHQNAGRLDDALVCRQRLCDEQPLDEPLHAGLMQLHHLRGDATAASAVFLALRQRLNTELGCDPQPALARLHADIQASPGRTAVASTRLPLLRPARMVGRDAACRELDQARAAPRGVALLGPAGIGKTRLLDDYTASLAGTLVVRLRPADRQTPWSLCARVLRAALARRPDAAAELPPAQRMQLARLLPELGAPPPGAVAASALVQAMRAALTGTAVLAIDDLQYADEESLALLPELCAACCSEGSLWPLFAARSGDLPGSLQQWLHAQDPSLQCLSLAPLIEADVDALLTQLQLPGSAQPALSTGLHRHSHGNPLFLLETLRALWDGERLRDTAGRPLPVSAHVNELLTARLRTLDAAALRLAQVAALADEDLDAELAAAVLQVHPLDLSSAWAALEAAQVLQGHAFVHELVREAALRTVSPAIARAMHERMAAQLAQRTEASNAHRAARHWEAAQRWPQAGAAWRQAALHSRGQRRRDDEAHWWEHAIAALERAEDRQAVLEAQAQSIESVMLTRGTPPALQRADAVLAQHTSPQVRATAALG
jgi:DNA-binding SARP family transcriptional activator